MPVPVLVGQRLTLRPPMAGDEDARRTLGFSPEVVRGFGRHLSRRYEMSGQQAADWYSSISNEPACWMIEANAQLIGVIRLHSFVPADSRASVAIEIFDERCLGLGYGAEAIRLLIEHAFSTLGLHRLAIRVLASNTRAIRCYEKCGFRQEGVERESARIEDGWEDDVIMGLVNPASARQP